MLNFLSKESQNNIYIIERKKNDLKVKTQLLMKLSFSNNTSHNSVENLIKNLMKLMRYFIVKRMEKEHN